MVSPQECPPGARALHNMSAPPRTTLQIRPLRADAPSAAKVGTDTKASPRAPRHRGLRAIAALSMPGLLWSCLPSLAPRRWSPEPLPLDPVPLGVDLSGTASGAQAAALQALQDDFRWLRALVAIARAAAAASSCPKVIPRRLRALTREELEEEWLQAVAGQNAALRALPPFALVESLPQPVLCAPRWNCTPVLAVALLAHSAGGTFCRGNAPVLPDASLLECTLVFYAWTAPLEASRHD